MIHVCRSDGTQVGEFSESEFREKIFSNEIEPEDRYWQEGMEDWKMVAEYRARRILAPAPPPILKPPPLPDSAQPGARVCVNCGYVGRPKNFTKGNIGTEILLWLFFLLPGLLYSLWRISSRYFGCPNCGAPNMIPPDSPTAKRILAQ